MNAIPEKYNSYLEERPWGSFEQFTHNEQTTVKLLNVFAGKPLSLQSHTGRQEYWRILSGNPKITVGENTVVANPGETFFIDFETKHRIEGGENDAVILEIAYGNFDEDDITRFEDAFGRA